MTTTKRIRNVAFLGLLVTLLWAGPVTLRADIVSTTNSSDSWYCAYGYCQITWTNCPGTWTHITYPDGPPAGDCLVKYEASGEACSVDNDVDISVSGSLYEWTRELQNGVWWWSCHQRYPD